MKLTTMLAAAAASLLTLSCATAPVLAAGSWTIHANDRGSLTGQDNYSGAGIGLVREATSDASDASVPALPTAADTVLTNFNGFLTGYLIVMDATVPPTSVVVVIKDKYGIIRNPDTDDTVNTASVAVKFDTPELIIGGLHATFTVVGNSKKFKFIPQVMLVNNGDKNTP